MPNEVSHRLKEVVNEIRSGTFGPVSEFIEETLGQVERGGREAPYFIGHDFEDYMQARKRAEKMFNQPDKWTAESIKNCVTIGYKGKFSSDQAIKEYPFLMRTSPI